MFVVKHSTRPGTSTQPVTRSGARAVNPKRVATDDLSVRAEGHASLVLGQCGLDEREEPAAHEFPPIDDVAISDVVRLALFNEPTTLDWSSIDQEGDPLGVGGRTDVELAEVLIEQRAEPRRQRGFDE